MRCLAFLVCALVASSCDLQPAKQREKSAAAVTPAVEPATPPAPAEPAPNRIPPGAGTVDAGVMKPPTIQTTDECTEVAVHITNLVISSIEDAALKAAQEQDRTRMVRRVAETCTRDKWPEAARKCFLAGKTTQEVESCGRNLKAPDPE